MWISSSGYILHETTCMLGNLFRLSCSAPIATTLLEMTTYFSAGSCQPTYYSKFKSSVHSKLKSVPKAAQITQNLCSQNHTAGIFVHNCCIFICIRQSLAVVLSLSPTCVPVWRSGISWVRRALLSKFQSAVMK